MALLTYFKICASASRFKLKQLSSILVRD